MPTHTSIPRPSAEPDLEQQLAAYREHVDQLDDELLALVARRREVSRQIQRARVAAGGPRIQHGREREILGRYRDALGADGSRLALLVLEICRGRA
jgi:chorismate mutase